MVASPTANPTIPMRRQAETTKTVDLRVEGDERAWKNLGDDGIVLEMKVKILGFIHFICSVERKRGERGETQ